MFIAQKAEHIKKQTTRKLKHKIDNNVIIFTLQCQNLLRICVYDERKITEIYEGVFFGDCLPNQAKMVFQSISQLFQFLEMNFAAMISIKEREAIVVDMNKMRIPCKFELPFILQVFPFVEDLILTLQSQNQQLNRQLHIKSSQIEQSVEKLINTQKSHQKHRQQLKNMSQLMAKLQESLRQKQVSIAQLRNEIAQKNSNFQNLVSEQYHKIQYHEEKATKFNLLNQQLKQQIQQLQKNLQEMKQTLKNKELNIWQLQQENTYLKSKRSFNLSAQIIPNQYQPPKVIISNQEKSIDQIINEFESKNQLTHNNPERMLSSNKQRNPFSGLFTKNRHEINSQSQQINPQSPSQIKSSINTNSRFQKLLQPQPNGQSTLNLSKRLLKDSDIQELVEEEWPNVCRLNLSQNIVTSKGLQILLDKPWPSLKSLSLSSNKISEFSLKDINFQTKTVKLMFIDLNFNPINSQTHKEIVEHNRAGKQPKILATVHKSM